MTVGEAVAEMVFVAGAVIAGSYIRRRSQRGYWLFVLFVLLLAIGSMLVYRYISNHL